MSRATSSATSVSPQQQGMGMGMQVPREKIAMRAYEKWCKRGRQHGSDRQDWIEAEKELVTEMGRTGGAQVRR
jgi:hypothetical protein